MCCYIYVCIGKIRWKNSVQVLPQYLELFEHNGHADVRQIKNFNHKMLKDIGFDNKQHRDLMLDEAHIFKRDSKDLTRKIEKHLILR